MRVPARRKKNGVSRRERDRPNAVEDDPILHEDASHNESGDIGGKHCLAPGRRRESPKREEHNEEELDLGFADAVPDKCDDEPGGARKHE